MKIVISSYIYNQISHGDVIILSMDSSFNKSMYMFHVLMFNVAAVSSESAYTVPIVYTSRLILNASTIFYLI